MITQIADALNGIFLWTYCLPIHTAILLIGGATLLYHRIRTLLRGTPLWKIGTLFLFACWLLVIWYGTIGNRAEAVDTPGMILPPLHTYYTVLTGGPRELLRESFMNLILFYPAGLLGFEILPAKQPIRTRILLTAAIFAILSIGIESWQYHYAIGLVEADDVLHNTIGTLLGTLASGVPVKLPRRLLNPYIQIFQIDHNGDANERNDN